MDRYSATARRRPFSSIASASAEMAPAMNAVKTTTICLGQSMCCIACLTIPLVVDVAVSPEGALNAFEARDKRGEEEREPGRVPSGVSHEQTGLLEQLALNQRGQHGHGVLDKPRARKRAHKPTRTVDAALALVLAVRPLLGGLASEPCEVFTVEETTTTNLIDQTETHSHHTYELALRSLLWNVDSGTTVLRTRSVSSSVNTRPISCAMISWRLAKAMSTEPLEAPPLEKSKNNEP